MVSRLLAWLLPLFLFLQANPTQAECPSSGMLIAALQNKNFPYEDAATVLEKGHCPSYGFFYGAFGTSPDNVLNLNALLATAGVTPKVVVYVLCGPCRRPRRDGKLLKYFYPKLTITQFNDLISRGSTRVLAHWSYTLKRVAGQVLLPAKTMVATPFWEVVIEAEDNLTDRAYSILRRRAGHVLPGVRFHRSPVGASLHPRFREETRETHVFTLESLRALRKGDWVVEDGDFVSRETEVQMLKEAKARGINILFWRNDWQDSAGNKAADKRHYKITDADWVGKLLQRK